MKAAAHFTGLRAHDHELAEFPHSELAAELLLLQTSLALALYLSSWTFVIHD